MQPPAPAPTAQGSFAKTPFSHLLVYALERRLSGTFELEVGGEPVATMLVMQGCPAKVRTNEGVHFLGDVLVELATITPEHLAASTERMQESPRLQGHILKEMGAVDDAQLDAGLRAQLERKVEHLFALPPETTYAYFDGLDALQRYGGPPTPIDPMPVLWRGVRQAPAWEHVDATLRRVGGMAVKLAATAQPERFQPARAEMQVIDLLREKPLRVVELAGSKLIGPSAAQLLVYFLVITKQVELVDAPVATRPAAGPPSGQAFARVQLQPRAVARPPLVVEEVAASPADDERASIPETAAPQRPGSSSDIGELINQAIASSLPPAPSSASTEAAPAIPPSPNVPDIAAPSGGDARLTPEQEALKAKIVERAEQITSQNYFQMLGIDKDATPEQVQKAFFALAKVWHPDRLPPVLADVKDACSKVFSHLTEAHATLSDPKRRHEYMTLVREGGATPDDQNKIQKVLEAATEFQKAEILMKRSATDPQVFDLVRRAVTLDPEQVDYMALYAWLEAQLPQSQAKDKTLEKIHVLDRCIQKNPNSERAYFYRAMLYKRINEPRRAIQDFKKVAELNPRNLDAAREVRLYQMRGGSNPPPGPAGRTSKPPQSEKLGLFGKLFKK